MAVGEQFEEGATDELLSFAPLEEGNGLEIVDHIEQRHFSIHTPNDVVPKTSSTDTFEFPIDRAVSIETDRIVLPLQTIVYVRNSLGLVVAEPDLGDVQSFPSDRYSLDMTAPIKLYTAFESSFTISVTTDQIVIDFESFVEVFIGARSYHKQPATTITTTTAPEDMMTALSYFGSALKTWTCERSYPTLRGHPPLVEIGDECAVPSVLSKPDTGVRLELPPDYRSIFTTATLAYYLGAEAVPGDRARIVTEDGFTYGLEGTTNGFETEVERVLKQVFFLDCITRTEGYYQLNLHERNVVEDRFDLDFVALYESPIPVQLERYLDVDYTLIEEEFPRWKLTAHVEPRPGSIEVLPFMVNDLAIIRSSTDHTTGQENRSPSSLGRFLRNGVSPRSGVVRSTVESAPSPSLIQLGETDSMEQTWFGKGAPIGASKAMIEGYRNRLDREVTDNDIDITVVCNDIAMENERDIADGIYGSREELPFDIQFHHELCIDELRDVLHQEIDFLHYIGHIDAGGFECVDGRLDAATLEKTGVYAFFLNACTSYQQGMNLIRAGSVGGVVTLQDVINSGAERIGKTLARLLNQGFPLRAALSIARSQSIMGGHYLVIGDGNLDIAQSNSVMPTLYDIKEKMRGYDIEQISYPNRECGIGTVAQPFIESVDEFFLASGRIGPFLVDDPSKVKRMLEGGEIPVHVDGELTWSSDIEL